MTESAPAPIMAAEGIEKSDATAVNSEQFRSLYKAREQIYPKLVHGLWRRIKWIVLIVTLGVYYGLPWIRWDRGPNAADQAVLVDFEGRRFYFFFIEIWPDEIYYITGLLILAAVGLFLVTALFGRVWCGYTCPQTVWTDLYIMVERWFEGDRNQRIRLDRQPWSLSKAGRKLGKHVVWLLIAAATGGAWVFYFHDAPSLVPQLFAGTAPGSAYVFLVLLTFTTYIFAGTMREQVCTYMCPWPRIQAAMTDEEALSVTYRKDRGEPRGPHKKGEPWDGRGDCIDCHQCVAACPMGIDIRDGLQLECINCALCIDACDDIMDRVGRPRGLIAYDTDINVARRAEGKPARFQFLRTRTIFYGSVFAIVAAVMLVTLINRVTLEINVLRDRNPSFVQLSDGSVRNGYTVKILNKAEAERMFLLSVEGPAGMEVRLLGENETRAVYPVTVEPDRVKAIRIYVSLPAEALTARSLPIVFRIEETDGEVAINPSVFLTGRS